MTVKKGETACNQWITKELLQKKIMSNMPAFSIHMKAVGRKTRTAAKGHMHASKQAYK